MSGNDYCFYHFSDTLDVVKQSAALCLLRLFRTEPNIIPSGEWTSRIIHLLNDQHMGVVTAATSLIDALVKKNPEEYKGCVALAVSRLSRVSLFEYLSKGQVQMKIDWQRWAKRNFAIFENLPTYLSKIGYPLWLTPRFIVFRICGFFMFLLLIRVTFIYNAVSNFETKGFGRFLNT